MNDPDEQLRAAFDRVVERRRQTTDVPGALVDLLDRRPWWHRLRFPVAIVLTAGAAAAVLLAIFGSGAAREAVETNPGIATVPSSPPTTVEVVTTQSDSTIPPPALEIATDTEAAIRLFLTERGDDYLGPCSEPAPGRLCSNLAEPGHGGAEWHQLIFDDADTGETLAVAPVEGGWLVVDTALEGNAVDHAAFDAGTTETIDWVMPDGRSAAFTATDTEARATDGLSDVWVGENLTGTPGDDADVCRRALVRIDSATGTTTEVARAHHPTMSPSRRYVAALGSEHEGTVPAPNASCAVDGLLVVRDVFLGNQGELRYENGGDIGGIVDVFWSPDSAHLAVVDGPDSTRTSIVAVGSDGALTKVELDRDVPELNGLISNDVVEWESAGVLVLRFYEFAGEAPDLLARYGTDGSFLGLVVPENTIDPVVDLTQTDWPTVLMTTPGLTYEAEPAAGPPPREDLGPYVQIGNSAGWADLDTIAYVDLGGPEGDDTIEAVITLVGGGNAGNAGVLVYAAGEEGPLLVGPTSFYDEYPGIDATAITDRLVAPLIIEHYFRAEWVPRAAGFTGISSRSYRLVDGALTLVDETAETSLNGGLFELRTFFSRLIEGDTEGAAALLAPDAELNIMGLADVDEISALASAWERVELEVDDGTNIANFFGATIYVDGGAADPRTLFGSNSCAYDVELHQCLLTSVSLEVDEQA